MGDWQFFAKRAASDLWLDNDVQMTNVKLDWNLSAANLGKARIPSGGGYVGRAEDGRPTWGRWDTLLLAEEDNQLNWVGICDNAVPTASGLELSFTSIPGWLYHVPYVHALKLWKTDAFDVVRMLLAASQQVAKPYKFVWSTNKSVYSVGDIDPGPEPIAPVRAEGQSQDEYEATPAYKQWVIAHDYWSEHKDNQYTVSWWEAPYIGEEIDGLASEVGFDYREEFRWTNKPERKYEVKFQLSDFFSNRREDISFVDGVNISSVAIPKDDDQLFANDVIALGAGEGAAMLRAQSSVIDGRLYQGQYRPYKSIRDLSRLRGLAEQDLNRLNNPHPRLDSVEVWDTPGNSPVGSLRVGNEVSVSSENTTPPYSIWCRIISISRDPNSAKALLRLEPAT